MSAEYFFLLFISIYLSYSSLMNLFEAGILDKMTNSEYEKMFGAQKPKEVSIDAEKIEIL